MLIAVLDGYLIFLTITNERILIPVQHRLIGFRGYPGIHKNLGPKASGNFLWVWMKSDPYSHTYG